jgi:hypothetical protein
MAAAKDLRSLSHVGKDVWRVADRSSELRQTRAMASLRRYASRRAYPVPS